MIRALGRLEEQGFVYRPKRGQIELTQTGRTMAEKSYARHQLVEAFLVKMGVPESVAAADAEGIEHHLGAETIRGDAALSERRCLKLAAVLSDL